MLWLDFGYESLILVLGGHPVLKVAVVVLINVVTTYGKERIAVAKSECLNRRMQGVGPLAFSGEQYGCSNTDRG